MNKEIRVIGGLGNQLFQFAFFLFIRQTYSKTLLDISGFKDYTLHNGFELPKIIDDEAILPYIVTHSSFRAKIISLLKYLPINIAIYYNERPSIRFRYNINTTKSKFYYFIGYWQSHKYFDLVKSEMLKYINFKNISNRNLEIVNAMSKQESISIHIRRGDYLSKNDFAVINENYYLSSIDFISNYSLINRNNIYIYVFSDDTSWAKRVLSEVQFEKLFVDWNKGVDSYQDMYLMTKTKYNIISNSTFSWWGAVLNTNKDSFVVAPKKWKKNKNNIDLYFDNWHIL